MTVELVAIALDPTQANPATMISFMIDPSMTPISGFNSTFNDAGGPDDSSVTGSFRVSYHFGIGSEPVTPFALGTLKLFGLQIGAAGQDQFKLTANSHYVDLASFDNIAAGPLVIAQVPEPSTGVLLGLGLLGLVATRRARA